MNDYAHVNDLRSLRRQQSSAYGALAVSIQDAAATRASERRRHAERIDRLKESAGRVKLPTGYRAEERAAIESQPLDVYANPPARRHLLPCATRWAKPSRGIIQLDWSNTPPSTVVSLSNLRRDASRGEYRTRSAAEVLAQRSDAQRRYSAASIDPAIRRAPYTLQVTGSLEMFARGGSASRSRLTLSPACSAPSLTASYQSGRKSAAEEAAANYQSGVRPSAADWIAASIDQIYDEDIGR